MGKSAPSPPEPVDPSESIETQARVNRISQFTPGGNLVYGTVSPTGEFVFDPSKSEAALQINETPFQQQFRQLGEQAGLAVGGQILGATPPPMIDLSGLPTVSGTLDFSGLPTQPQDLEAHRGEIEQAYFQRGLNLLQPQWDTQERRLDVKLANQGLPVGSEAYGGAFGEFLRQKGTALDQLANEAILTGGQEQTRQLDLVNAMRAAGLGEQTQAQQLALQARQAGLGEQQAIRSSQLQELAAILGGQGYNPTPAAAFYAPGNIDVTGAYAANQAGLNANYQAQVAQTNASNQGLAGLASAAMMAAALAASSRTTKHRMAPIATVLPRIMSLPVEVWEYLPGRGDGRRHIGPYAEDFRERFGVGDGETLSFIDVGGVALQGIKELGALVSHLLNRIKRLEAAYGV